MIINTHQLDATQLKQLEELRAVCKKSDKSTPNLYTHILSQPRVFPASLLYYDNNKLIGFLSVYFFYEEAVEVTLLIHPQVRRQGIASELIRLILPLVHSQNYHSLIFSSPSHLNTKWLKARGYTYLHSENYMERDDLNPLLNFNKSLHYRTATYDDIPVLCELDKACFPSKENEPNDRFHHLIDGREYEIVLALDDKKIIGKAHFRWLNNGATLSDIAVLPEHQGKGWGTALIANCINYALSEGKPNLNLDVETHNQRALNLYTRLGFRSQNACDYWSIDIPYLFNKP